HAGRVTYRVDPAEMGPARNPVPDGLDFRPGQPILLAGRHFTRLHLAKQQALVRLSGDKDGPRLTSLGDRRGSGHVEVGLGSLAAVAANALRLQQGADRSVEGRAVDGLVLSESSGAHNKQDGRDDAKLRFGPGGQHPTGFSGRRVKSGPTLPFSQGASSISCE